MSPLLIQPARSRQQAASLAEQLQRFASSRKGAAAAAAILLAGGGIAYIQQVQAQQKKARQRYVGDRHRDWAQTAVCLGPFRGLACFGSVRSWSLADSNQCLTQYIQEA